jgi:Mg/Co/Ni transporter MgtE
MNDTQVGLAMSLATNAVPTAASTDTASDVLQNIQAFSGDFQAIDYIYVLDERKLIGVISLHELFSVAPQIMLQDCMTREVAQVHAQSDQETVAQLALAQNIKAVPVVNRDDEFVGVVTSDTILQILRDEHTEDILKYAGINFDAQDTLSEYTLTQHFTSRIPWLILGLFGGILAAWVVDRSQKRSPQKSPWRPLFRPLSILPMQLGRKRRWCLYVPLRARSDTRCDKYSKERSWLPQRSVRVCQSLSGFCLSFGLARLLCRRYWR